MHHSAKHRLLSLLLAAALLFGLLPSLPFRAEAADEIWVVTPTGYTDASQVVYVTSGGKVANWGVREEPAVFLTTYAQAYYVGDVTYERLSQFAGGTGQNDAPTSPLYGTLQSILSGKQSSVTSYNGTRDLYKFTDCMASQYQYISSFYSGIKLNGNWDNGATWNREHTWPNSKISGNGENDIMMLRPTAVSENTSRGNAAYGVSDGYYDPNSESNGRFNLRGDCARIVLYVYVRWGVTDTMWGQTGVMENLDVLLAWMEEDPVDTWEMGRNDSVQSITGVRNIFVDYPELAWQLFGQKVPATYPTPSNGGVTCANGHDYVAAVTPPTCTEAGFTTYTCSRCGNTYTGDPTSAMGHDYAASVTPPTCTEAGFTAHICSRCGNTYTDMPTEALGHDWDEGAVTTEPSAEADGVKTFTCLRCSGTRTEVVPFRFDDVKNPSKYYYAPVYWALRHRPYQITKGTDATHFSPNQTCSRAQVVSFLWNGVGKPEPDTGDNPFVDVKPGKYYYKAVLWAYQTGVTKGADDTHFNPSGSCTRAQVVSFIWNAAGKPEPDTGDNPFVDVKPGKYYYKAVLWAVENGITKGADSTHFNPNQTCTRGQIVTFLYNTSQLDAPV